MLLCGGFFPLRCLRAPGRGGAWVPGGPRPGFRCWLCFHDPDIALLIMHQDVSHVSLAKWASPQFENHVQFFHFPSTDAELTGPGYINQLACEEKKMLVFWSFTVSRF